MNKDVPVKTADTIFKIIETLVELDGATLSELTRELDKPTSTVHDHLHTLDTLGFVVQEDTTYHISCRFLELGAKRREKMDIYQKAKPELQRLAEDTGEHASLMIEENGLGVILHSAQGENAVHVPTVAGARSKLHMTAPGKAIMMHLSEKRVKNILERYNMTPRTDNTITDRETLEEEFEQIRKQGYAIDDQELFDGMRAVAAPLIKHNNRILGAISVYGPVNRIKGERFDDDIPNNVLQSANVIEVNISYS